MPRPTSISHEKIISVAREVFLEKGMQATTAEVARRAGVAEGTIFYKFKTKYELFKAAMTTGLDEPEFVTKLAATVGTGDVRENLETAIREGIAFFRSILPLIFMAWSNQGAAGLPDIFTVPNPPPLRILKRFSSVLEAEIRAGRLERRDPEVLARLVLGSMQQYAFFEMLMQANKELPLPVESYARSVVGALYEGIAPARSKAKGKRGSDK
jgi:AcrR family transcriptional regulator